MSSASRRSVALVAALQFVYIVDFMMVLPLGPDLAQALGFSASRLGWLAAAYTLAALAAGALALRFIDRLERRRGLLASLALFTVATGLTAWAQGLPSLLAARAATGLVGAPMVALGMALVLDSTPPEARGRAIGRVMMGFSLAAIAGVPLSLLLARQGGWTLPFLALAGVCAVLWGLMWWGLPQQSAAGGQGDGFGDVPAARHARGLSLLRRPAVRRACLLQALSQFSAFLLIPNFSAYYLLNLGLPRDHLSGYYLAGGLCALGTLHVLGGLADRRGPALAVGWATLAMACGLLPFWGAAPVAAWGGSWGISLGISWPHAVTLLLPFVLFMAGNAGRNVALAALTSHVPAPHERARFMALQNMVQDLAIALAALLAAHCLVADASGRLSGMAALAGLSLALSAALALAVARGVLRPAPSFSKEVTT